MVLAGRNDIGHHGRSRLRLCTRRSRSCRSRCNRALSAVFVGELCVTNEALVVVIRLINQIRRRLHSCPDPYFPSQNQMMIRPYCQRCYYRRHCCSQVACACCRRRDSLASPSALQLRLHALDPQAHQHLQLYRHLRLLQHHPLQHLLERRQLSPVATLWRQPLQLQQLQHLPVQLRQCVQRPHHARRVTAEPRRSVPETQPAHGYYRSTPSPARCSHSRACATRSAPRAAPGTRIGGTSRGRSGQSAAPPS